MGETKEKKIAWWRSDLARGVCVFIGVIFLALIFEGISKVILPLLGNPGFLMISDKIIITDLLVGVFTAQVTMITIAITFTGLLVQLFGSKEEYLGMSLREAVFQRKYMGLSLPTISLVAIILPTASYCFVAKYYVSALIVVFIFNIGTVSVLLSHYLMYAISVKKVHQNIREAIDKKLLLAIKKENESIKRRKGYVTVFDVAAQHVTALQTSLLQSIKGNNWTDYIAYNSFFENIFGQAVDATDSLNDSTIIEGLVNIMPSTCIALLEKSEYEKAESFFIFGIRLFYKNIKDDQPYDVFVEHYGFRYIRSATSKLALAGVKIMNKRLIIQGEYIRLFAFLVRSQFAVIERDRYYHEKPMIAMIFQSVLEDTSIMKNQRRSFMGILLDDFYYLISVELSFLFSSLPDVGLINLSRLYVYELTAIMRLFYNDRNDKIITQLFDYSKSKKLGIEYVEKIVYPTLALNFTLFILLDSKSNKFREKAKNIRIACEDGNSVPIIEYTKKHITSDVCVIFYKTMVRLKPMLTESIQYESFYDNTYDIVLILIMVFFLKSNKYKDIIELIQIRFKHNVMALTSSTNEIKAYVEHGTDEQSTYKESKIYIAFISLFGFEDSLQQSGFRQKILANLDVMLEILNSKWK